MRPARSPSWGIAPLVLAGAAACAPGEESPPDAPPSPIDARPGAADARRADAPPPPPDAPVTACPPGFPASYGDLGTVTATKRLIDGSYKVFVDLPPDVLFVIEAIPGRDPFAGGVKTGTYEIAGIQTDYQRCAACVFAFASFPDSPESVHLMADKGILQITSIAGEAMSGRLTYARLRAIEIVYDGEACSDTEDPRCGNTICLGGNCGRQQEMVGCETTIDSMRF